MAADARCAWWSFHGLNSNFHRGSSVFVVVSSRFSKRSWNESTGSWPRNHGSSERSVKGLLYNDSRLLLIYLQFGIRPPVSISNIFRQFEISIHLVIRYQSRWFDDRSKEILYIDWRADFYRFSTPIEKRFDDKWWKIVGRKLSRVSTHTHTHTHTHICIFFDIPV